MSTRTGWEHYDLEKEIYNSNVAQLLELFKRETEKFLKKCVEYANSLSKLTLEGQKELEEEAKMLDEGRQKIALQIAERLTDTKASRK